MMEKARLRSFSGGRSALRSTFTAIYNNTDFRQLPAFIAVSAMIQALGRRRQAVAYRPASLVAEATNQALGEALLPEFRNYNRSRVYLTFGSSERLPFSPLPPQAEASCQQVANALWYWNCQGQNRLTLALDRREFASPRAVDALWWLMQTVTENYRQNKSPGVNLGNYGTRTLQELHRAYYGLEVRHALATTDPKWWPFCRQVWEQLPQLIGPEQVNPMLAAYYGAYLHRDLSRKIVTSVLHQESSALLAGRGSTLHRLLTAGARTISPMPDNCILKMRQSNVQPVATLFLGASASGWEQRRKDILQGRY